jgi:hypothetical protein
LVTALSGIDKPFGVPEPITPPPAAALLPVLARLVFR